MCRATYRTRYVLRISTRPRTPVWHLLERLPPPTPIFAASVAISDRMLFRPFLTHRLSSLSSRSPLAPPSIRPTYHQQLTHPKMFKRNRDVETDPLKRFKMDECLGSGAFASIFKAYDKQSRKACAIKKIAKKSSGSFPMEEYNIGKRMKHPNVVKTMDW